MAVQTSHLWLGCVLVILATNFMLPEAAPLSDGSGGSQVGNQTDRDLLAGLQISGYYSRVSA